MQLCKKQVEMKKEATIMAMPVKINVIDKNVTDQDFEDVFSYLRQIDEKFSTFNDKSEAAKINSGKFVEKNLSDDMKKIIALSKQTKHETNGYFDVYASGEFDPTGIVKGWAIFESSKILLQKGLQNFYLEIAGDIQVCGKNGNDESWKIGIENPFDRREIVKVLQLSNKGIATSGIYINGEHIIDPINKKAANDIISITVIGPNVYEADRFATAVFAMGEAGIRFLEEKDGLEGYMITKDKHAYTTTGFEQYLTK